MPGAVTSGLIQSPLGPREENEAMTSACVAVGAPWLKDAITFVWPLTKASSAVLGPSTWIAGSQWLSVSVSCLTGLYSTIPAAPPRETLKPLSTRALPPRWHSTTLPVADPAVSLVWQSASSVGMPWPSTTGVGAEMPLVSVKPGMSNVAPPSAVRCSVDMNERGPVDAPTVVTHGPPWSAVEAPGPLLPAEALTEMPALVASRNASSTASVYGRAPPEIEKLMTLTPSTMACWTAATESEPKQPCAMQTR